METLNEDVLVNILCFLHAEDQNPMERYKVLCRLRRLDRRFHHLLGDDGVMTFCLFGEYGGVSRDFFTHIKSNGGMTHQELTKLMYRRFMDVPDHDLTENVRHARVLLEYGFPCHFYTEPRNDERGDSLSGRMFGLLVSEQKLDYLFSATKPYRVVQRKLSGLPSRFAKAFQDCSTTMELCRLDARIEFHRGTLTHTSETMFTRKFRYCKTSKSLCHSSM
jgi:hypothetical protein